MIGHDALIADLTALHERGALGHGYIFYGPTMVGKRTAAVALGHFLEKGTFMSEFGVRDGGRETVLQDTTIIDLAFMRFLDPDASGDSIGIDAVREVKNFLWQRPAASTRRTLIIDGAELLTTEAQNALLKVAEEPPASSLLILVTSDTESILPTIVSRLPTIYFGAVPQKTIAAWLTAEHGVPREKAGAIAAEALGKPGIAWRLVHDEAFRNDLARAEQFLKTTPAARRDFIKKLIEPEDFSLRRFLDGVILTLAREKPSKAKSHFWHKTLQLYGAAANFNPNPRLQLEALMKQEQHR